MKILVIPDVHLKPWMFERASELIKENNAQRAVCLMDIADDWRQQYNLDLYMQTYDAAIRFAKDFPDTLWCYGNHDLSYLWQKKESGYSPIAARTVCEKLRILRESLPDERQLNYLQRIDNVLFSHGGLSDEFVMEYVPAAYYNDADAVIEMINGFGPSEMWQYSSPVWYRPRSYAGVMYSHRILVQAVGHTPVKDIIKEGNVISCDVFSTDKSHKPLGTQKFPVIDTVTGDCCGLV